MCRTTGEVSYAYAEGYLTLTWRHRAADRAGEGSVERVAYDYRFCSTPCLRRFLNRCVDDLEAELRSRNTSAPSGKGRLQN